MKIEEHKARHQILHEHLDELFADYIQHHPNETKFTKMPILKLIDWSYRQTIEPDELNEN